MTRWPLCLKSAALLAATTPVLAGCVSTPGIAPGFAPPFSPVVSSSTPYSAALACITDTAMRAGRTPPHVAVDSISDMTGKLDENTGNQVTKGAALMAMSALGKAHIPIVERYQTDVPRIEYRLADNKLISDAPLPSAGPEGERPYRPIMPGVITGSDLYITGGITELNTNIHTGGGKVTLGKKDSDLQIGSVGADSYTLSVAMDLRLVNSRTLDVLDTVSYQKLIVGRQVTGNVFSFFGNNLLSISGSDGTEEPVHFAVRALIERGVMEMLASAYDINPDVCLRPDQDPLNGTGPTYAQAAPAPAPAPAPAASAPRYAYSAPVQAPPVYQAPAYTPPPAPGAAAPTSYAMSSQTSQSSSYSASSSYSSASSAPVAYSPVGQPAPVGGQGYLNWTSRQYQPSSGR